MKVLFVTCTVGNGGIQSWAKNYLKACTSDCELVHLQMSIRRSQSTTDSKIQIRRIIDGVMDMFDMFRALKSKLKQDKTIDLIHCTTSGSLSTIRDFFTVRIAHRYGVKIILHCHYGCIPQDYLRSDFWGWLLRKTLRLYDQIWVLDSESVKTLSRDLLLKEKVKLAPNFIDVPKSLKIAPKDYKEVAFVGNLDPLKGLYELVEAVTSIVNGTRLTIIGPGRPEVISKIKELAGKNYGSNIVTTGKLTNEEAVELIAKMDIIALPTYFPSEAFPISILEAMSRGKLVISTNRAAIPDMLTDIDGNRCGMLVTERSSKDIVSAILWCQFNSAEADMMCKKSYEKVMNTYDTKTVLTLYRSYYDELISD